MPIPRNPAPLGGRAALLALITLILTISATPGRASTSEPSDAQRFFVRGSLDETAARSAGLLSGARAAGWTTLRVPGGRVDALRVLRFRRGTGAIVPAPHLRLRLDAVAVDTRLSLVRTVGPGGITGPAGGGVLVGIVDTGIDLGHLDFRRPDGTTRIVSLWDQTSAAGTPPASFSYGSEWSAAAINAGSVVSPDDLGHGTHVAGIAAGNGRGGVAGLDADRYVGIAPEASLCIVKADFSNPAGASAADIIDGVAYVFARAAALGMPAVVNLSLGSQEGPHDGTHPVDEMLEAMTGPGRIIVAAAGNEGADRIHARVEVPAGGMSELTFRVPDYTANAGAENDYVLLSAWHDRADSLSVTIVTPSGATLGPLLTGSAEYETVDGHVSLCLGDCTAPGVPAAEISVRLHDVLQAAPPGSGTWKLRCTRVAAGGSGRLDGYVADQILGEFAPWTVWQQGAVTYGTILSPASSDSVIAVGAHTTKPCWPSIDGSTSCVGSSGTTGQLAFFSSRGPRRDGVLKPDLTAPGNAVVSTRSAAAVFDVWETVPGGAHAAMMGTSMAAPAVSGAVALLLARSGWAAAGPTRVRDHLRATARADGFTGSTPNDSWGYGKLDILSVLSMTPTAVEVGAPALARFTLSNAAPNPFNPRTSALLDLARAGWVSVRVHDVAGRQVRTVVAARLPAGRRTISWDGRDDRGAGVASGVYYLVVSVDGDRVTRKVTLLK